MTPHHLAKLEKLLKGQYSLRELAGVMRQDLTQLSLTLVSYEQQGWIKLLATDDLALPAHIASPQLNPTKNASWPHPDCCDESRGSVQASRSMCG
ncbi:MAG: hypothetical protein HC857_08645 [Synechococcales cyanobacterium RU_4_20]|nr:hypothetical protein [Synechococcales cyanobacterium RU_4_20]